MYVSGSQKKDSDPGVGFTMDAVKALEVQLLNSPNFKGVDILLTSQWPKGVEQHAAALVRVFQFPILEKKIRLFVLGNHCQFNFMYTSYPGEYIGVS